jgi:dihydroneopterin aldolase
MFKININNLAFSCIIGILNHERSKEQKIILDISFEYFFKQDDSMFIDYSKIVDFAQTSMKSEKFQLLEDAILFIKKGLKQSYDIKNLKVKITKPDIISNCIVSVEE